ncbi:MAG: S-adenosyl-L-methionine-dependent methyltransferase [Benjaminiella poitrasii]|nr:MAG: S-adenosyl-L-methionine-dependent methyltransferase [Benjaminiella poitrasii]
MVNGMNVISIDENNTNNNSTFSSFLKLKWRTSKGPKLSIRQRTPNTVDDIERDWVRHCALKLAFEGDFKAPIQKLLQAGGCEILDIGCGAGFWTSDMASQYPISYFTGIDIDKNSLPTSSLSKNVFYQRIDLIELPLPYEDATFDYIYIRSMMETLPDSMWDDILKDLIRVMKKGAYIECIEAYDNLFDAGPSMTVLNQLIKTSLQHPCAEHSANLNPWPNRIANMSQLKGMQIYHTHTPVGLYGGAIGSLLLEYWERSVKGFQREWITNKWIAEDELEQTIKSIRDEVDEYRTYMSWYSVIAQKKGYNGPVIHFDDVDDFGTVNRTTIC